MADSTDYSSDRGPTPISYTIPLAALEYILRMNDLGLIEGAIGDQKLNPDVDPIISALHNVLAGGEVQVTITRKGNPDIVRRLGAMLAEANAASNQINKSAGFYVTIMV
jgi:hypothetical protein